MAAAVVVVNDSGDVLHSPGCATTGTGTCTLRDAITFANGNAGADSIHFDIPGTGVQTIAATDAMPPITDPAGLTIDGYTQPAAQPNTLIRGNDAVLLIEIDASGVPSGPTGMFTLMSDHNVLRGLVVNRYGIEASVAIFGTDNWLSGNFLGTNPSGTAAAPSRSAVYVGGAGNRIGGSDPSLRNLLVGESLNVVELVGAGNVVQGNYIGTNADGTASLGPFFHGIATNGDGQIIGGLAPGEGNLISGNGTMLGSGIIIASSGNLVAGNLIGTDRDGVSPVPNGEHGVFVIENTSNNLVVGNVIAFNGTSGVQIGQLDKSSSTAACRVTANRIFGNGGLGIDIGDPGTLPNDPQDTDAGANGLQNYPVLTAASSDGVRTTVTGTLNSAPNTTFILEFFASARCDESGFGQGRSFLGTRTVTTDGNGDAPIDAILPAGAGGVVAATATDAAGNTSEFSACVAVSSRVVAGAPPLGPEFQVNTSTSGLQYRLSVAEAASGSFVVTWTDRIQNVVGLRFDENGAPAGSEFVVNTTTGQRWDPSVAMDESGDFVVAWGADPGDGDAFGVFGRRYDSVGAPLSGEFQVNQYTTGNQQGAALGMNPSGDFVVSWWSDQQDGSGYGVFARRYSADGTPLGSEFPVNTYTTIHQMAPSVALAESGEFVIAWQSAGEDGYFDGVFAQRFDSGGAPQGPEFQVNEFTTSGQAVPRVAYQPTGDFVVVWTGGGDEDGSGNGVFGRRFDGSGDALGGEFQANSYTTGYQGFPSLAVDRDGAFVVAWHSYQDGSSSGVFGRSFDDSGRPIAADFQLNAYTTGPQAEAHVAMNPSGNFVVSWRSLGQDGDNYGVFARRGELKAPQPLAVDPRPGASSDGNGVLEPGETVSVEPAWMDTGFVSMVLTGSASNLTGPPGPTYTTDDATADYGELDPGSISNCYDASAAHDCYRMTVSGARPAGVPHWDATFDEAITGFSTVPGLIKHWTLHVGGSFPDVPSFDPFYPYIENLFHHEITAGCGILGYCPTAPVNREQMAVFLLKAEHGASYVPPPCTGIFQDVQCGTNYAEWIEQLYAEGITGGCGGGFYCPTASVTRAQMAVFLLKTEHGPTWSPPPCSGVFADVPCPGGFAVDYVEALAAEAITVGCGAGNYCPASSVNRAQMAVFLVRTFGLLLYGP